MATLAPAAIKLAQPTAEKVVAAKLDQSTAGHLLKSNFSHHTDNKIHNQMRDKVQTHTNKYTEHPTRITVTGGYA
eukprot:m.357496 g.357496  ORF g.357496 m.357496 type:complete len:75 (-) comp16615_c0_seq16:836-1060(-)